MQFSNALFGSGKNLFWQGELNAGQSSLNYLLIYYTRVVDSGSQKISVAGLSYNGAVYLTIKII